jgi:hypothetical protein
MFLFVWLERPWAFFAFFVSCKVLGALSQVLPALDRGSPDRPPRWLAAIMRRCPRQNGETFDEHWARTHRSGAPQSEPLGATAARRARARVGKRR